MNRKKAERCKEENMQKIGNTSVNVKKITRKELIKIHFIDVGGANSRIFVRCNNLWQNNLIPLYCEIKMVCFTRNR